MIPDERERLWYFGRGERIAVAALLVAIAIVLGVRRFATPAPDMTMLDTTWVKTEIPAFEERLSRPEYKPKKSSVYTPRQQDLTPLEQDK